jgi:hypothetical protein
VWPKGLGKFKNSPHRVWNPRPSGLQYSAHYWVGRFLNKYKVHITNAELTLKTGSSFSMRIFGIHLQYGSPTQNAKNIFTEHFQYNNNNSNNFHPPPPENRRTGDYMEYYVAHDCIVNLNLKISNYWMM